MYISIQKKNIGVLCRIVWKFKDISFRLNADGTNLVEDTDVADERQRIRNENNFILRIENLTKYFRKAFGENLAAVKEKYVIF